MKWNVHYPPRRVPRSASANSSNRVLFNKRLWEKINFEHGENFETILVEWKTFINVFLHAEIVSVLPTDFSYYSLEYTRTKGKGGPREAREGKIGE